MTVSSTEVRWQNRRVHVPDYGSSHVAVKQHENCEGTREKDQGDIIGDVIKKLAGFAFIYCNVPAGSRSSCSEISECDCAAWSAVSRSHAQQTPSVYQKPKGSEFAYYYRHRQNTSTCVKWFYCGNEAHGNEQVNIYYEWCYLKTLGNPSEHLSKLTNTHSCIVAVVFCSYTVCKQHLDFVQKTQNPFFLYSFYSQFPPSKM